MYFSSLHELLVMSGHGPYVWSCVVFSTLLILLVFGAAVINFRKQRQLTRQLGRSPE